MQETLTSQGDPEFGLVVQQAITKVMNHADVTSPSAVWGKRLRLLKNLNAWINLYEAKELMATLGSEDIITHLNSNELLPSAVSASPT